MSLDPAIAAFYAQAPEEDRLTSGDGLLELLRTRELIERHAPAPPATVLDIGGAAGVYALWLADRGYTVHLVDASPRLVAEAERRAAGRLASCRVGDARQLEFADRSADVVLLLGPLYHLTDVGDRKRALAEARRVLKAGGWLFAAVISRWASALDGLNRDLLRDPAFASMMERDLAEGQHRNSTGRPDYFTTAYFHRPDGIAAEIEAAGFADTRVFGIEGPGWLLSDIAGRMADERRRADMLRVARLVETEPALLGVSAHLLAVARSM
jgi:ubiquinone/menaquinone biosynthesis C-methylase UbiE